MSLWTNSSISFLLSFQVASSYWSNVESATPVVSATAKLWKVCYSEDNVNLWPLLLFFHWKWQPQRISHVNHAKQYLLAWDNCPNGYRLVWLPCTDIGDKSKLQTNIAQEPLDEIKRGKKCFNQDTELHLWGWKPIQI